MPTHTAQKHLSYSCQVNRSEQGNGSVRRKRLFLKCENCKDWIKEQCSTEHNGINYSWAFQGLAVLNRCIVLSHQFTLSKFHTFRLFLLWWYLQTKWRVWRTKHSDLHCYPKSFWWVYPPSCLFSCVCAMQMSCWHWWQRGQIMRTRLYCVLCPLSAPQASPGRGTSLTWNDKAQNSWRPSWKPQPN